MDNYAECLDALVAVCQPLMLLPIAEMQSANERFQALGPILDPTAYQRGGSQNLHDQRSIIDAALGLQRACEALRPGDPS
jgi:hypothetical protein